MIPTFPMQVTLWGSTLYAELATGLWLALAAPWLQPGWPVAPGAPARPRPVGARPVGQPAAIACPAGADRAPARTVGVAQVARVPPPPTGRVIEVPRGRWQHRRARGAPPPIEG